MALVLELQPPKAAALGALQFKGVVLEQPQRRRVASAALVLRVVVLEQPPLNHLNHLEAGFPAFCIILLKLNLCVTWLPTQGLKCFSKDSIMTNADLITSKGKTLLIYI